MGAIRITSDGRAARECRVCAGLRDFYVSKKVWVMLAPKNRVWHLYWRIIAKNSRVIVFFDAPTLAPESMLIKGVKNER